MSAQLHVIPLSDGWGVFATGAPVGNGSVATQRTQAEAKAIAVALAIGLCVRADIVCVVHDRAGRIREKRAYPRIDWRSNICNG